jgi:hypothetical protein
MMSAGATGGTSSEGLGGMTPLEAAGGAANVSNGGSAEPGAGGSADEDAGDPAPPADDPSMSFFVTSRGSGSGGDFGGIAGADTLCTQLAAEASAELGNKTWRAYLSTASENARDRIGMGPWRNAAGVIIASSLEQLHDQGPTGEGGSLDPTWPLNTPTIALDEQGNPVANDAGTRHDIITGSNADGTVSASGTCSDWTSQQGTTRNGHSDRVRFMQTCPRGTALTTPVVASPRQARTFKPEPSARAAGAAPSIASRSTERERPRRTKPSLPPSRPRRPVGARSYSRRHGRSRHLRGIPRHPLWRPAIVCAVVLEEQNPG